MKSIIKQLYNGDLCLSERGTACVAEFRGMRDIAVQAHDAGDFGGGKEWLI